ncbi:MAG: tol-pal system-associated acyl-CoA thioesterase [Burkholderiaceae bacterium]|nr:tol-pal system-associated acyl-CoA thioesterase [Burkholderiaceae bacterium]
MEQPTTFDWPVRVYYEDTDAAGVVYYANYLRFLERARTEWMRHLGWEQQKMREELGMIFVVASINAQYRKPAKLDDKLIVRCHVKEIRKASLMFIQDVFREDELLLHSEVRCGSLNVETMKPKVMPDLLLNCLKQYID